jgi:hypothetical protein
MPLLCTVHDSLTLFSKVHIQELSQFASLTSDRAYRWATNLQWKPKGLEREISHRSSFHWLV